MLEIAWSRLIIVQTKMILNLGLADLVNYTNYMIRYWSRYITDDLMELVRFRIFPAELG